MNDSISEVKFLSWNSTGIDRLKCQYYSELIDECEVNFAAIQEHFKTTENSRNYFNENFPDCNTYVKKAFRRAGVDSGRGIAGLAQMIKKDLKISKKKIIFKSPRIQGQLLQFGSYELLWINLYWPVDNRSADDEEISILMSELEANISNYPDAKIIAGGDWNFNMQLDTAFTKTINDGLERMGLESLWKQKEIDYTYEHTDRKSRNTLDHFMVSKDLIPYISDMGVIHSGDNLSGHSPIFMSLRIDKIKEQESSIEHPIPRIPSFDKANPDEIENYINLLQGQLEEIKIPEGVVDCWNSSCKQEKHKGDSDDFILSVVQKMIEASHQTIPLTGSLKKDGKRGPIPGWNNECRDLRLQSRYTYRVWVAAGKPNQGEIHTAKLRAHSVYMQAIRRIKRNQKRYEAEALLEASLKGDLDLFREMKRVRTGKTTMDELPEEVESANGEDEIAEKFRQVYENLYNSSESEAEMDILEEKIRGIIESTNAESEVMKMNGSIVKEAICRMKPHKMDISQGWSSDSLLYGPDILFDHLAAVFRCWMRHGYVTQSILACAFIPLLKSQLKDPAVCDSYRAIAGSSLILKAFEQTVLILWGDKMGSDSLQFGFKKRCSTNSATWLVNEVLGHYLRGGSKPIAVVLDCSKAFDLAKFDILFNELLDKGVPAIVVRVLIFTYKEQLAWVRWGRKSTSNTFRIRNGTRQGSVASPTFWSVYLNPLFEQLREAGVGCTIGGLWMGMIGYADDIILLAPTRSAAQQMLNICEDFATMYNIRYSTDEDPKKSKCKAMYMVGKGGTMLTKPMPLVLCNKDLPWVETCEHLGHTLSSDGTMKQDIREKRAQFINSAVNIRETFSYAFPEQIVEAVDKYACSFYSSNLWDLNSPEAESVFATWRTNLKLAWDCPRATRGYLVQDVLACGQDNIRTRILLKFKGFHDSLMISPSKEARMMVRVAREDIRSSTGSNIKLLQEETGLDPCTVGKSALREALRKRGTIDVPEMDLWRPKYLKLQSRSSVPEEDLIGSLCIN